MELVGICFDKHEIFKHQSRLQQKIETLNSKAEKLLKHRISLASISDVQNVIYDELKLISSTVRKKERKRERERERERERAKR